MDLPKLDLNQIDSKAEKYILISKGKEMPNGATMYEVNHKGERKAMFVGKSEKYQAVREKMSTFILHQVFYIGRNSNQELVIKTLEEITQKKEEVETSNTSELPWKKKEEKERLVFGVHGKDGKEVPEYGPPTVPEKKEELKEEKNEDLAKDVVDVFELNKVDIACPHCKKIITLQINSLIKKDNE